MTLNLFHSPRQAWHWQTLLACVLAGTVLGGVFHVQALWALGIKWLCVAALFAAVWQSRSVKHAAAAGWAWSWGAHITGMGWLYVAMHDVGGLPVWLAGAGLVLLAGLLGIFAALSTGLVRWISKNSHKNAAFNLSPLSFAATWVLGEWLRTWVLTGLPWMSLGYGFIDSPAAGFASSLGVLGVGASVFLAAGFGVQSFHRQALRGLAGLFALGVLAYLGAQYRYTQPNGEPLSVALIQGNVPQTLKFDADKSLGYMADYAKAAAARTEQLVVLPETALPAPWETLPEAVKLELKKTPGLLLVGTIGIARKNDVGQRYTNRLSTPLTSAPWHYDKSHLVPFGEVIPPGFQWFVDLMNMPLSSLAAGGQGQTNLKVNDLEITPNICYEELFAHEWRGQTHTAHILLNTSNFGWYGKSSALPQHANLARMRALEFQKPYLSATNNGSTLAVLPTGVVESQLADHAQGVLSTRVQGMTGLTPYARWGDWGAVILAMLALLVLHLLHLRAGARR